MTGIFGNIVICLDTLSFEDNKYTSHSLFHTFAVTNYSNKNLKMNFTRNVLLLSILTTFAEGGVVRRRGLRHVGAEEDLVQISSVSYH